MFSKMSTRTWRRHHNGMLVEKVTILFTILWWRNMIFLMWEVRRSWHRFLVTLAILFAIAIIRCHRRCIGQFNLVIPEKGRGVSENVRGKRRQGEMGLTNIAYTMSCRSGYTRSMVRSTPDKPEQHDVQCKRTIRWGLLWLHMLWWLSKSKWTFVIYLISFHPIQPYSFRFILIHLFSHWVSTPEIILFVCYNLSLLGNLLTVL